MLQRLLLTLWVCCTFFATLAANGDLLTAESFQIALDDCDATAPICIDIPPQTLMNYGVLHNGQPYSGGMMGCNFQTRFNYALTGLFDNQSGVFQLTSWTIDNQTVTGSFTDIFGLLNIINSSDPDGNWAMDSGSIIGGQTSANYGTLMITRPDNSMAQIAPAMTQIPQSTTLNFGRGIHEVVLADMMNACLDTFTVTATCMPTTFVYEDTLLVNDAAIVLCLNTNELTGTVDTIFNDCEENNGEFTSVVIDEELNCVKIRANKAGGVDTICIVICDDLSICDTTTIIITTESETTYVSETVDLSIPINMTDTYCIDTTELEGNIVSMQNACPLAAGGNADITFDSENFCVTYSGINIGTDSVCVVLVDDLGGRDTTTLIINVVPPMLDTIYASINIDEMDVYCPATDELAGDIVEFVNVCPDASGMFVDFGINNVTLCVEFSGVELGTDTACLVLCDDFGVCDTTTLIVTVLPSTNNSPIAVDDTATTPIDTPTAINILGNDIIPGSVLTEQYILSIADGGIGPLNGGATINSDGTLTYTSAVDFCGMDSLQYVICNVFGCDTATVNIEVECFSGGPDDFTIFTGFSPNGDDVNDVFFIENVEQLPDNEIFIYNRWGLQVFEMTNYDNSWEGRFNDNPLPDGTYYYLFRPGDGREFAGWLVISR